MRRVCGAGVGRGGDGVVFGQVPEEPASLLLVVPESPEVVLVSLALESFDEEDPDSLFDDAPESPDEERFPDLDDERLSVL